MSKYTKEVFDPAKPVKVKRFFVAAGRHWEVGREFPWKKLSISRRRVALLMESHKLTHKTISETKAETKPKVEPKTEPKVEPKTEPKVEPKTEPKVEPKTEPKAKAKE